MTIVIADASIDELMARRAELERELADLDTGPSTYNAALAARSITAAILSIDGELARRTIEAADVELLNDVELAVGVVRDRTAHPMGVGTLAVAQAAGFTAEARREHSGDGRARALRALRRAESDGLVTAQEGPHGLYYWRPVA